MGGALVLVGLAAGAVRAAPHEAALGRAEGYPVCAPRGGGLARERCLVGTHRRLDPVVPARRRATLSGDGGAREGNCAVHARPQGLARARQFLLWNALLRSYAK